MKLVSQHWTLIITKKRTHIGLIQIIEREREREEEEKNSYVPKQQMLKIFSKRLWV